MTTANDGREPERALVAAARPRRRHLVVTVALLAGLFLAAGAWLVLRPQPPQPPAIDPTDIDPEVVDVIERARAKVLESPRSGQAWGRLGMLLLAHDFGAESLVALAEAERLDPKEPRWPYLQGITLELTDPEGAIAKLRQANQLSPQRATRLRLASLLLAQGHLNEAGDVFGEQEQAEPGNAWAQLGLAQVACARGDWTAGLDHLRRAVEGPDARPKTAHILLAEVYRRLPGRETEAEQEREIAARLPDDSFPYHPYWREVMDSRVGVQARIQRGGSLRRRGHLGEAVALLRDTAERYRHRCDVWLELGACLSAAQDFVGAESAYREAIRCDPNRFEAHFRLGAVLDLQRGQRPQAVADAAEAFRRAIRVAPTRYLAHLRLGLCLQDQNDWAGAVAAYRSALHVRPDCAFAHAQLAQMLLDAAGVATSGLAAQQLVGCPAPLDITAVFRAQALIHFSAATALAPEDAATRQALERVRPALASERVP